MEQIETKYITFKFVKQKPKTQVWHIISNSSQFCLGVIEWYPQWRQYCFFPTAETVFNFSCLVTISDFIGKLTQQKGL